MLVFKRSGVGALILSLAACGIPRQRPHEPPKPGGAAAPLPASGEMYRVDEGASEVRILVYRAGPLARLGHNHVVVSRALRGEVSLAADAGGFRLTLPVASFVVDDAAARRDEGTAFEGDVPDDAKAGTLQNMLSPALLDAARFPAIAIESSAVTVRQGAAGVGEMSAAVVIDIAGHESAKILPFTLKKDADRVTATGSVELRQSDLGLTPYSLMLGALQVQDAVTVKFTIVATHGQADGQG